MWTGTQERGGGGHWSPVDPGEGRGAIKRGASDGFCDSLGDAGSKKAIFMVFLCWFVFWSLTSPTPPAGLEMA